MPNGLTKIRYGHAVAPSHGYRRAVSYLYFLDFLEGTSVVVVEIGER